MCLCYIFFNCSGTHRDLHSFPTRRSSDLEHAGASGRERRPHLPVERARLDALAVAQSVEPELAHDERPVPGDRKSTRLNSSHSQISYAVFCLKKKEKSQKNEQPVTRVPWI